MLKSDDIGLLMVARRSPTAPITPPAPGPVYHAAGSLTPPAPYRPPQQPDHHHDYSQQLAGTYRRCRPFADLLVRATDLPSTPTKQ